MKNITLFSLLNLAIRYIWVLLLSAAIFASGMFTYCNFIAEPKYSATGSVLVTNGAILSTEQYDNLNIPDDSTLNNTDIIASINFADTVTDILNTNGIFKKLSFELNNRYSYSNLVSRATVSRRSDSSLFIDVSFSATTKEEAILLVNEFLKLAPDYIKEFVPSTAAISTSVADTAKKTFPRTVFSTALSGVIGMALVYGIIVLVNSTNTTISTEEDFKSHFNIDILASIPDFESAKTGKYYKKYPYYNSYYNSYYGKKSDSDKKKKKSKSKPDLVSTEKQNSIPFAVVEAYKNLRINLTSALAKNNSKIVAISSSNASEGKSTTSVNIAIMLAQLNKKVVLIDTDSRRASIHQKLKLKNEVGCLDVISGNAELKDVINTYNPYLDVILVGKSSSSATELFDSPEFDRLLAELNTKYDYIILDTPPINLVADALVVSKKCDGLLLMIRSNVTPFEAFNQTKLSVDRLDINLLGVVLNGVGADSKKYYKYKKYYGYNYYNKYNKYGGYY